MKKGSWPRRGLLDFCEGLPWTCNSVTTGIEWHGRKGVLCRDAVNVTLALVTSGTSGTYTGFLVRIVHKERGELDSCYFDFDVHLDPEKRSDDRYDYPHHGRDRCYCVIEHTGADWYVAVPTTVEPLCRAIAEYVAQWD